MAVLSIKVTIANRVYPLKVNEEEEENIRKAAKMINERVKEYGENFAVRDTQDLLAMCALRFANESIGNLNERDKGKDSLNESVSKLDEMMTSAIKDFSRI